MPVRGPGLGHMIEGASCKHCEAPRELIEMGLTDRYLATMPRAGHPLTGTCDGCGESRPCYADDLGNARLCFGCLCRLTHLPSSGSMVQPPATSLPTLTPEQLRDLFA